MLQTHIVFFDANIFYRENFNFSSSRFRRLYEVISESRVALYTTELINREIENGIVERVRSAVSVLQRASKPDNAGILRSSSLVDFNLFFSFSEEAVIQDLRAQLADFMLNSRVHTISTESVSNTVVFDRYFSLAPPFGEGKKRKEFSDAFSLYAISQWCSEREVQAYVVSEDGDWKSFCAADERLLWLNSLDDLLNLITSEDQLAGTAWDLYDEIEEEIATKVAKAFENLGFFLDDRDGDVGAVQVLNAGVLGEFLLTLTPETATFGLDYRITYSARIVYDDPEFGYYDSDDHFFYSMRSIEKVVQREAAVFAEVQLNLPSKVISEVVFPSLTDIAVTAEVVG